MSAAPLALERAARFYGSTLGKKAVMAITGVILFGFTFVHMAGNLQFYLGPEVLNAYGAKLRAVPALLWAFRIALLAAVVAHIVAALQLWSLNRNARPESYRKLTPTTSTFASRTMMYSGPLLFAFVAYHLYHFTLGPHLLHDDKGIPLAYQNVVAGFSDPIAVGLYLVAMGFLGLHLYHGVWSMFQSVGWNHPKYTPKLRRMSLAVTLIIVAGNISIPIAVLTGIYKNLPGH
jgi:succinate dehydrogenase / fumarate reductase cytochrome b subunit